MTNLRTGAVGLPAMEARGRSRAVRIAAFATVLLHGCSTQNLEKWHTTPLTEEYRVTMASEVRSLEDYLRLEERLFAQLDTKIYARNATGPAGAWQPGVAQRRAGIRSRQVQLVHDQCR